ncbi:(3R)-hydroxyacyl-ACP dehydratase subunit HadB [Serratia quinivorans]|uniref:MaoC/PaaZ C-terminal domain-containing protein n=1 Tax=Serratia TaxID=613 RepID=UPI001F4C1199|nr:MULTISPECIES: MaoC/PaaZ C-terminal domain-containing protein [Serratia]ULG13852.1 hypothetical protein 12ap_00112 [Serratia proteamaculans]ULG13994.1 hypothetical protein 12dp_00112 [Serratia proteamaculans]ULG14349.1 hypothetical protein 28Fp_00062 [Serratia proteamaculans]ULG14975.1 hypothetical protein 149p1_00086 [Serratia proteamaculans]ULG15267.1 hypothetical protein 299p_00107 [Serratia proteamaculans]
MKFNQKNILSWAEFSGDYNPIHFSLSRAKTIGVNDIIVHGMLVLVYIHKNLTFDYKSQSVGWMTIKAFFRSPCLSNISYGLVTNKRQSYSYFSLLSSSDNDITITGSTYLSSSMPQRIDIKNYSIYIDESMHVNKKELFMDIFPEVDDAWIFISALSFSMFLQSDFLFERIFSLLDIEKTEDRSDIFTKISMLQTMHTAIVSPLLLRAKISDLQTFLDIKINISDALVIKSEQDIKSFFFKTEVFFNENCVMQTEIGLQIKR